MQALLEYLTRYLTLQMDAEFTAIVSTELGSSDIRKRSSPMLAETQEVSIINARCRYPVFFMANPQKFIPVKGYDEQVVTLTALTSL